MGLFSSLSTPDGLAQLLLTLPAVLWAISFHEFCHGYTAYLVGDPTAYRQGRLSLNPLAHFDLVGTLMLLFVGVGWARPVPINTRYFRHPKRDIILVSLAGAAGNILTAFVCALFLRFLGVWWYQLAGRAGLMVVRQLILLNIGLAAFNLIPIPPLDGSKVLYAFLPFRFVRYYYWLEQYGMIIILILAFTNIISVLMQPLWLFFLNVLPLGQTGLLLMFGVPR